MEKTFVFSLIAVMLLLGITGTAVNGQKYDESDSDQDGIPDIKDNCVKDYNPDQADSDFDGIGDVCDSTPYGDKQEKSESPSYQEADSDQDGIADSKDNCIKTYNPDQTDSDSNGIGDVCDVIPYSKKEEKVTTPKPVTPFQKTDRDSDKDGIPDSKDNCPKNYNPSQKDSDFDGAGDTCDKVQDKTEKKSPYDKYMQTLHDNMKGTVKVTKSATQTKLIIKNTGKSDIQSLIIMVNKGTLQSVKSGWDKTKISGDTILLTNKKPLMPGKSTIITLDWKGKPSLQKTNLSIISLPDVVDASNDSSITGDGKPIDKVSVQCNGFMPQDIASMQCNEFIQSQVGDLASLVGVPQGVSQRQFLASVLDDSLVNGMNNQIVVLAIPHILELEN